MAEIQAAATGGAVVETRTTTYADGRTEVVERRQGPDWRAAAWALEHGPAGSRWRRADKVELSGPEGGAIPVDTTDVREERLRRLAVMRERIAPELATNGNGTVSVPPTVHSPDA